MSTAARFDVERVSVVPGMEASCQLTVANNGGIVEAYSFQPVGDLAQFTTVEPDRLSLYPGTEGSVTLRFNAPRDARVRAGEAPFGVVVTPVEQPDGRVVPEGLLDVQPFAETTAELTPRTSQARLWAKHSLALDNRGNLPVEATVTGGDPDGRVRVRCKPEIVPVDPGEAAFTKVRVSTRPVMWKGAAQTRPFRLLVESAEQPPIPVDGQVVQEPIFPRGTGKALAVVAACVAALVALWFGLLKPTIKSTAQEAVKTPVAQASQAAAEAKQQAQQANKQAEVASSNAVQANRKASAAAKAGGAAEAAAKGDAAVKPFGQRMSVDAPKGETRETTYEVPKNKVVTVTDLVFESTGDTGSVRLLRNKDELITVRPQDYRTLDQHFVSPIVFTEGEQIVLQLTCGKPSKGKECHNALYVGGTVEPEPKSSPKPSASKKA